MSRTDDLRNLVAAMLMVPPADITDSTSLQSLNTSLGSAKVRLGLKRLGLTLPPNLKPSNFAALTVALSEGGPPPPPASRGASAIQGLGRSTVRPGQASDNATALAVGLDVEQISALPAAVDYWEHDFYRTNFSPKEIAYAILQAEPRTHFAGFWCAKEALRKCDAAFAGVGPDQTAIAHEPGGRPYLTSIGEGGPERLPHVVSITHTEDVAAAVVVTGCAAPEEVIEVIEPALVQAIDPAARKSRGLAKLFGI